MSKNDWKSYSYWLMIIVVLWIIAWIIAEAIPVFSDLLSLISALFASWFTYGLSGVFWLFMNRGKYFSSPRKIFLTVLNVLIFGIGAAIVSSSKFSALLKLTIKQCGLGLYASGLAIHSDSSSSGGSFSCADNREE